MEKLRNLPVSKSSLEIPLENFGNSRVEALRKSVHEIQEMVSQRKSLSEKIYDEIESLKSEIKTYLAENEKVQISSSDPTKEKTDLRHKKIELSEMQLKEKVDCWKDIAILKKDLRELEREIVEKEERTRELNKILGEGQN